MAIVNRDLDASEQRSVLNFRSTAQINTGATHLVALMPYAGSIQSARAVGLGLSGAPIVNFQIQRFAGGNTVIACGISGLVLNAFGTSGVLGYSGLAAQGSTLLNFQAGDMLLMEFSGANTAALTVVAEIVVKKTQDIVSMNGV